MASDSYDSTRDPRTGRPPLPIDVEKARKASLQQESIAGTAQPAKNALQSDVTWSPGGDRAKEQGQRPEALAQFGESAREESSEQSPKELSASFETAPIPADNTVKHDVATRLLNDGAHGVDPDPDNAGEDRLPDRITHRSLGLQATDKGLCVAKR